ncbi:MAG: hypothetical protein EZS28_027743 [Streblomastix strix]|uniref:Uncharacterized protein n=1 Tax=Streblomastix strix TaxID=222440 RepID=A0A5J4V1W4_9EUKA|nr:MAG: hypothetical protein EZS28_027743 [Streblomastix strix]
MRYKFTYPICAGCAKRFNKCWNMIPNNCATWDGATCSNDWKRSNEAPTCATDVISPPLTTLIVQLEASVAKKLMAYSSLLSYYDYFWFVFISSYDYYYDDDDEDGEDEEDDETENYTPLFNFIILYPYFILFLIKQAYLSECDELFPIYTIVDQFNFYYPVFPASNCYDCDDYTPSKN